jgi:trk system potassium uptake protein TrkA
MLVIIAGGGRTGSQLAKLLLNQEYEVRVIEDRKDVLSRIHRELPTEAIFEGDPDDLTTLELAGIREAQVLAACTTSDQQNLVLCYIARQYYNVPRTIGRVNDPRNASLFDQIFCVDVALNQADILAKLIEEEMSLGDMMILLKLRRGKFSLVEEKIPITAPAVGVAIKDLKLPEHCVIAGIIRHGDVITPRGQTVFEIGDEVLAVVDPQSMEDFERLFSRSS